MREATSDNNQPLWLKQDYHRWQNRHPRAPSFQPFWTEQEVERGIWVECGFLASVCKYQFLVLDVTYSVVILHRGEKKDT